MRELRSTNGRKSELNGNANLRPIHNSLAKPEIELPESAEPRKNFSLEDFHAYMPNHAYIFVPTREMWPAKSVNARIAPISMKDATGGPVLDDAGKPKYDVGERVAGPAQAEVARPQCAQPNQYLGGLARDDEPIRPMTLRKQRRHGVRGLFVTCRH
jgi:hypothetical protein